MQDGSTAHRFRRLIRQLIKTGRTEKKNEKNKKNRSPRTVIFVSTDVVADSPNCEIRHSRGRRAWRCTCTKIIHVCSLHDKRAGHTVPSGRTFAVRGLFPVVLSFINFFSPPSFHTSENAPRVRHSTSHRINIVMVCVVVTWTTRAMVSPHERVAIVILQYNCYCWTSTTIIIIDGSSRFECAFNRGDNY